MTKIHRWCFVACVLLAKPGITAAPTELTVQEGSQLYLSAPADHSQLAFELAGRIWLMPIGGGEARAITPDNELFQRPVYSPDGATIAAEILRGGYRHLVLLNPNGDSAPRKVTFGDYHHRTASWSSDGRRLLMSSDRGGNFSAWELDIDTLALRQQSFAAADEHEPIWDPSGQRVAVVVHGQDWSSVLEFSPGEKPQSILNERGHVSGLSWRPDRSALIYVRTLRGRSELRTLIMSQPRVKKTISRGESVLPGKATWPDRERIIYAADGQIKVRRFAGVDSKSIPFRASLEIDRGDREIRLAEFPAGTHPKTIVRAGRLYDGLSTAYRLQYEMVVENGRITAVRPWTDEDAPIIIDARNRTLLPGLIDAGAGTDALGVPDRDWLSAGITTIRADSTADAPILPRHGNSPGPRVMVREVICPAPGISPSDESLRALLDSATRKAAIGVIACESMSGESEVRLIGLAHEAGLSVASRRAYPSLAKNVDEIELSSGAEFARAYADILDAIDLTAAILPSRLSAAINADEVRGRATMRARAQSLFLATGRGARVVAASARGDAPRAASLHQELRLLAETGLQPFQVLKMATLEAARALGAGRDLGSIETGKLADAILVDGDPLSRISDAARVRTVILAGQPVDIASPANAAD